MMANEIIIQPDKAGIADSAVSVVVPDAVVYLPLEDLVDFEQERERLAKEEVRLNKEIKRAQGMLSNEKFVSKAPAAQSSGRERQAGEIHADARTGKRENCGTCEIVLR